MSAGYPIFAKRDLDGFFGLAIGLAWFLVSRTLSDGGEVLNLNAIATAWLPTGLLAIATGIVLSRTR